MIQSTTDAPFFIVHNPVKFITLGHVETYPIGAVAVVGYIINVPLLYYFIEGINSAIASNKAVLFVLLGKGLVCLSD
jgi:hypothetical protein